jgi:hypothetical protein
MEKYYIINLKIQQAPVDAAKRRIFLAERSSPAILPGPTACLEKRATSS